MDKDSFCPSPWFHILISADGSMHFCRWGERQEDIDPNHNISDMGMTEFLNSDYMKLVRREMVDSSFPSRCDKCYRQDRAKKVNGRQKQLYKCDIYTETFERDYNKSDYKHYIDYSMDNNGATISQLRDLQVDMGSVCNSACIYCFPESSTSLYHDYKVLNWLTPKQTIGNYNWMQNPANLKKFTDELPTLTELRYLHLIGGEPLFMDCFKTVIKCMVDTGMHEWCTLGFTTNCTVFDESLGELLKDFKTIHLGLSIDCPTRLNDYVRYPSNIEMVLENIEKFRKIGNNVAIQIRPTPTVFSMFHYHYLMDWLLQNNLHSEVCHFINNPVWLKLNLLPLDLRREIIHNIQGVINKYGLVKEQPGLVIDTRSEGRQRQVVLDDAIGFMTFLEQEPEASESSRSEFVQKIISLEKIHKNRILDYLPEYTDFLRTYGYDK